ncbi:N-acetyltransferase family protein [Rothia sp. P5766]|uniref:GNAT family N-acetyltransferase n=1 Tax=Rothia sp. P5766 TaxID=3402656 RepID=UPI003ADF5DCE
MPLPVSRNALLERYAGSMKDFTYRELTATDTPLLETATLGTMNWCGPRFTLDDIRGKPEFAHYTRLIPERGDLGLVAYSGEHLAGAAWALYLPASDSGYGYFDSKTPELSLWVAPEHRGQGLGRRLLRALLSDAGRLGATQVSLSVEDGNQARQLYLAEGFVPVAGREKDGVMVCPVGEQLLPATEPRSLFCVLSDVSSPSPLAAVYASYGEALAYTREHQHLFPGSKPCSVLYLADNQRLLHLYPQPQKQIEKLLDLPGAWRPGQIHPQAGRKRTYDPYDEGLSDVPDGYILICEEEPNVPAPLGIFVESGPESEAERFSHEYLTLYPGQTIEFWPYRLPE